MKTFQKLWETCGVGKACCQLMHCWARLVFRNWSSAFLCILIVNFLFMKPGYYSSVLPLKTLWTFDINIWIPLWTFDISCFSAVVRYKSFISAKNKVVRLKILECIRFRASQLNLLISCVIKFYAKTNFKSKWVWNYIKMKFSSFIWLIF